MLSDRRQQHAGRVLSAREIVERIAERRGITIEEAWRFYRDTDRAERNEIRLIAERRAAAGNPVLKPRSDFTGIPRRS